MTVYIRDLTDLLQARHENERRCPRHIHEGRDSLGRWLKWCGLCHLTFELALLDRYLWTDMCCRRTKMPIELWANTSRRRAFAAKLMILFGHDLPPA